ncbi:alpha/beta hydrolase family protein [Streptacidiphilus sp. N1-12]|uniref:Alpha/beta hydrolase family protein n=2 Tax=Streptacidiphilus alkalitolerans TaxID=3342712 RepID=A0ABV6V3I8_9ACTN
MATDARPGAVPPPVHLAHYGPHPEQVVDLRLPPGVRPGEVKTLLVLIHGGFWKDAEDRSAVAPLADALALAGYAVAVPEYRRVGSRGGGWPGTFDDIAMFFEMLDTISAGHSLRPRRTVLVGHAAGAHLALWAAARHRLTADEDYDGWRSDWRPDAVVSLAGCSSLDLADAWSLGDDAAAGLLGGSAEQVPDRYAVTDPMALLPLGVTVTLLHGTQDANVPVAMSRAYATRAEQAGDQVHLVELAGLEHLALIDPESSAWPDLLAALKN